MKTIMLPTPRLIGLALLMVLKPALAASPDYIDWMHHQQAPKTLATSAQTVVILADDIDLGQFRLTKPRWVPIPLDSQIKHLYLYDTPPDKMPINLILIADTLRLSDSTLIHLQRSDAQKGGNLLIIARQIIVSENGLLSFKSAGKQGGNLKIIYDSIQLSTKPVEMWAKNLANEIDKSFGRLAKAIPHWQQEKTSNSA